MAPNGHSLVNLMWHLNYKIPFALIDLNLPSNATLYALLGLHRLSMASGLGWIASPYFPLSLPLNLSSMMICLWNNLNPNSQLVEYSQLLWVLQIICFFGDVLRLDLHSASLWITEPAKSSFWLPRTSSINKSSENSAVNSPSFHPL